MRRMFAARLVGAAVAAVCHAHAMYIVTDGPTTTVVFSDDLEPDENVAVEKIAKLKLEAVLADAKTTEIRYGDTCEKMPTDAELRRAVSLAREHKLKVIFKGKKSVTMFELTKLVNEHLS